MKIAIVFILLFHSCFANKDYTNYSLFRTLPLTNDHLEFVKNLPSQIIVDYWKPPGLVNKTVDILINPEDKKKFMRSMDENQFYYTTIIDNIQKEFDKQTIKTYVRRKMESYDWKSFYSLKDIYSWMYDLEKLYPSVVKILKLGRTYENRELLGAKVILRGSKRRSAVVIEGGIHAREWISTSFVTYFLHELVIFNGTSNPELAKIAYVYEFYFLPVMNPDGYAYSINQDRMWRKNRYGGYGVDINRNFDVGFGTTGVSQSKKEEIYCGTHAFSEKESQAVQKLTRGIKDKLEFYLAFHSYGQYLIIPYAHLKQHTENYDDVYHVLQQAKTKIATRYSTKYVVGTAYETVGYTTSGVSGCWVKKELRVPYVVTFELRDSGTHGFALPPDQILPTCRETLDGVAVILTPKTNNFRKLSNSYPVDVDGNGSQEKYTLDTIVIVFNIIFFVIVRFY